MSRTRYLFFSFLFVISLFICERGYGERHIFYAPLNQQFHLKDCLLPSGHPLQSELNDIFKDKDFTLFNSPQDLRFAGFQVLDRVHRNLMVIGHPNTPNYLFKKFQNNVDEKTQLRNFVSRINGARNLQKFIRLNKLKHIVTPKKWLYPLPKRFSNPDANEKAYLLVVEKIDICGGGSEIHGEVAQKYREIDIDILSELCAVVYYFRGLDSVLHNMPFTHQDKIAFIDTERWNWKRSGYLYRAMPFLSPERQEYAQTVFKKLQAQDTR